MDLFSLLTFIGGLSMFLYGMNIMGGALEKQAGGRFKNILERITTNPLSGVVLGAIVTSIIQSSSATTVMVVGFINSGIMQLENAFGVIMGANIGTTITAWLLSLIGIESSNVIVQMFKPSSFSPILALIGIGFLMFSKSDRKKDTAHIMLGFAILMFGMDTMSNTMKPLADMPQFTSFLTMFSNPVLGILTGTIVTGIIQSSSASIGILQAMSMTVFISYNTAIPIILGQNIGTCVTAMIASVGTNVNARRSALIHLSLNLMGSFLAIVLFTTIRSLIHFPFLDTAVTPVGIAVIHTLFNFFLALVFMPFHKQMVDFVKWSIKDDKAEEKFQMLDERFFTTPSFAVAHCRDLAVNMFKLSRDAFFAAMDLVGNYNEQGAKNVLDMEEEIDVYEDKLGAYLVRISRLALSVEDSHEVSRLLHNIGDFERIGDHSINVMRSAEEMYQKNLQFSDESKRDLATMDAAMREIIDMAVESFTHNNETLAMSVEPLEQVVDLLKSQLKARHIARLQRGECNTISGFVYSDLITNYERAADHCSNIAVTVIQGSSDNFETHSYLNAMKNSEDSEFTALYSSYREKYRIG